MEWSRRRHVCGRVELNEQKLTENNVMYNSIQMPNACSSAASVLAPAEVPAFDVFNASGKAALVLVCEHASNRIPAALGDLGLSTSDLASHIAWDLGASRVARHIATAMDAPLAMPRFSRLVYDCNRPFSAPDAIPDRSESCVVHGNADLSAADRAARFEEVYVPFRDGVAAVIDGQAARGAVPAVITIHSFTPVYFGVPRTTELGVLHDEDAALAGALLTRAAAATGLRAEANTPYGPEDGVTHTLKTHALPRGLPNAMLEIRNDLIADVAASTSIADRLVDLLREALESLEVRPISTAQAEV